MQNLSSEEYPLWGGSSGRDGVELLPSHERVGKLIQSLQSGSHEVI